MEKPLNTSTKNQYLWQQFLLGDAAAFKKIYLKNAPLLAAYGKKITPNKEIVNDAIQDVFINLWQKRERLPVVQNTSAYLLKALRNRILRILESRSIGNDSNRPHQAFQESYEHHLIRAELASENLHKLHSIIEQLPARQKEVINLKYFQNLKTDEIADILNINYQSASNLLYKGIKALKKQAKQQQNRK